MEVHEYIDKMKAIQTCLLKYLDEEAGDNYNKLIELIDELQVSENRSELKSILQLMSAVIQNHHRSSNFFTKIEKILINYIIYIKQFFTKTEVYEFFQPNQRILLFLLQNDLISSDDLLKLSRDYIGYFYPEIKEKIDENLLKKIENTNKETLANFNEEEFSKNRLVGENDSYVCKLIREDSIEEFIKYFNQHNLDLEGKIPTSLFDTNSFFIEFTYEDKNPTLIEYAFFCGSIQIVKYLREKGVILTSSLWPYAIHSNNAELISMLEEEKLIPCEYYFLTRENRFIEDRLHNFNDFDGEYDFDLNENSQKSIWMFQTFKTLLVLAIQCHDNDIFNYIESNAPEIPHKNVNYDQFEINPKNDIINATFKYFNYICFPDNIDDNMLFFYACKYDYVKIVELFLKNKEFNINETIILYCIFYTIFEYFLIMFAF